MITISRTQQSKLNSSLGSEKMDTKHKQHTKANKKTKISQTGLRRPDGSSGREHVFWNTQGVRAPSRGVRTDYSGLPPRLVGVRTPSRGVRTE